MEQWHNFVVEWIWFGYWQMLGDEVVAVAVAQEPVDVDVAIQVDAALVAAVVAIVLVDAEVAAIGVVAVVKHEQHWQSDAAALQKTGPARTDGSHNLAQNLAPMERMCRSYAFSRREYPQCVE